VLARGTTTAAVGHVAFTAGVELHGLAPAQSDLETIFLRLVDGAETPASPPPHAVPSPLASPEVSR
jgi:ABC-2 type transport system ATP-binding protein